MIFNSAVFFVFFVLFFGLFWWINKRFDARFRNAFTILGSYVFYGWWDWRFLGLIVLSSSIDYLIGRQLGKERIDANRKMWLAFSVFANISILWTFKYFDFFFGGLIEIFSILVIPFDTSLLKFVLPVGISFYTFQTLSYTIDIYRRKIEPTNDPISFFAFVSFFPQLVAGPIERAKHLLPQFTGRKVFSYPLAVTGLRLILWGLFKKVVIADNLGVIVDQLFKLDGSYDAIGTVVGSLCFAFQIYADFSGYSDMAIGFSRLLGFDLMQNFRSPYWAASLTDFWKRWHVSLSTWFRDYVYIPLGGSQNGQGRFRFAILVTFLLSGLWHGASWTFVVWGGLHGLALLIDKSVSGKFHAKIYQILTFITVVLLWLPFRAETTHQMIEMAKTLVRPSSYLSTDVMSVLNAFSLKRFALLMIVLISFVISERSMNTLDFSQWVSKTKPWLRWATYYVLILVILVLGNYDVKPNFIYFQF